MSFAEIMGYVKQVFDLFGITNIITGVIIIAVAATFYDRFFGQK